MRKVRPIEPCPIIRQAPGTTLEGEMKKRIMSVLALLILTFVMAGCEIYEPFDIDYPHYGDGEHEGRGGDD